MFEVDTREIQDVFTREFARLPIEQREEWWSQETKNEPMLADFAPEALFAQKIYIAVERALDPFRAKLRQQHNAAYQARYGHPDRHEEISPSQQAAAIQIRMREVEASLPPLQEA